MSLAAAWSWYGEAMTRLAVAHDPDDVYHRLKRILGLVAPAGEAPTVPAGAS